MLSASPASIVKSSLEEMLESLRRQDEDQKPKNLPPALPSRPTSKARLPSARRSLPTNFSVDSNGENGGDSIEVERKEEGKRKEEELGVKRHDFGSRKMRNFVNVDSPYSLEAVEGRKGEDSVSDAKVEVNDNLGHFIKKVSVKVDIFFQLRRSVSLLSVFSYHFRRAFNNSWGNLKKILGFLNFDPCFNTN